jgi:hypothetical protein
MTEKFDDSTVLLDRTHVTGDNVVDFYVLKLLYEFAVLGDGYRLPEGSGKRLDVSFLAFLGAQIENVGLSGRRKLQFLLNAVQTRRQHHAE